MLSFPITMDQSGTQSHRSSFCQMSDENPCLDKSTDTPICSCCLFTLHLLCREKPSSRGTLPADTWRYKQSHWLHQVQKMSHAAESPHDNYIRTNKLCTSSCTALVFMASNVLARFTSATVQRSVEKNCDTDEPLAGALMNKANMEND